MSGECRLFVFVSTLLALCFVQGGAQECGGALTCSDCVGRAGCSWCTDTNFTAFRCMDAAVNNTECSVLENPTGSVGDRTANIASRPIDLSNINLNLRVGEPQTFTARVTALRNLPLDLYILMDLSSSMGPVLTNVRAISGEITSRIANVTNNVRLAFGSYNDKDLLPFTPFVEVSPVQSAPFAFRHRVDFTANTSIFSRALEGVAVTVNIDNAENLFEALAQVVVCEDVLKWRNRADTQVARVVLVLTDAGFHYAGEGQFGGILTPYEGNCLLRRTPGMSVIDFTDFGVVDYPSVGQIAELLQEQDVNVIFGVTAPNVDTYENLASVIGRGATSELDVNGDAVGILDIIDSEYRRLLRDIFLQPLDPSNTQFTVEVTPTCPSTPNTEVRPGGDGCTNVQLEDFVDFSVTVTLNSCDGLEDGQTRQLTLNAGTFGTFTVTVTGRCNCNCEDIQDVSSSRCSGNGNFTCGVCECNEGYCGPNCELTFDGTSSLESCPVGGPAFFNERCSGRGQCNCVCNCQPNTFGDACQCDTFSEECKASPDDEEVCSGRGMCCNKACVCRTSPAGNVYRGTSTLNVCQCEPAEEVCDYRGVTCNGRGTCGCERCACLTEWEGDMCQIPRADRCNLEFDISCISTCRRELMPIPDHCMECNEQRPTLFVDMMEIDMNTNAAVESYAVRLLGSNFTLVSNARCESTIDSCVNDYFILDNGTHNAIVVVREQDCPSTTLELAIPIWSIAIIIVGALILLGILIIIIIKIIFIILDYYEVKRWQKEAREADFSKNQNPLYQSPEMQYTNVAYGKPL